MTENPFQQKKGKLQLLEALQKSILFLGTYTIVVFTLYIFGTILWNGFPVLKQYGWNFISRKPETLEVVGFDQSKLLEIKKASFDTLLTYNPKEGIIADEENFKKPYPYTSFKIKEGSFISDGYLAQIEKGNDFYPDFKARDTTAPVGFLVKDESILNFDPETFAKLQASSSSLSEIEARDINFKVQNYKVSFEAGFYKMQAKTVDKIAESALIYYLFGNLKDTVDDEADTLMNLEIPRNQVVVLTPSQKNLLNEDGGNAKFDAGEIITTEYPRKSITVPAGNYTLPFDLFIATLDQNPSASIVHLHNIDKGVIALDLSKTSDTLTLPTAIFEITKTDNPQLLLEDVQSISKDKDYVRFSFAKACEIKMPTSDMSELRGANAGKTNVNNQPRLKILNEHVHPYSAGGIAGPIMGTALLVIACMVIGLFVGVAAAVFLGEYSKKGRLISVIRLAMMNLAGVPSIVFGLFGLGLFVVLAPKFTDTPSIQDKLRIPIVPSWSEPDLRTQERNKIKIIKHDDQKVYALRAAQQQGLSRYYDGYFYLSFEGWGNSILAGSFTLAIMVLPIIITSSEESLRAVPRGFREASLALGATKWQSIRTAVLPYATPGILTASVLGITRVAGETAPIMFTAAVAEKSDLPTKVLEGAGFDKFFEFMSQSVQAMPYHIYTVSGKIPQSDFTKPMQYGSVLVFMIIVMVFAGLSVWLRIRMRKKYKW